MNTKFLVSSFIFSRPYYQTPVEIFRERPWNPYSFSCRSALTLSWDYWRWAQLWFSGANTNTPRLPWLYNCKFKGPGFREPEGHCACAVILWRDEELQQSRTTKNWNFLGPLLSPLSPSLSAPCSFETASALKQFNKREEKWKRSQWTRSHRLSVGVRGSQHVFPWLILTKITLRGTNK